MSETLETLDGCTTSGSDVHSNYPATVNLVIPPNFEDYGSSYETHATQVTSTTNSSLTVESTANGETTAIHSEIGNKEPFEDSYFSDFGFEDDFPNFVDMDGVTGVETLAGMSSDQCYITPPPLINSDHMQVGQTDQQISHNQDIHDFISEFGNECRYAFDQGDL